MSQSNDSLAHCADKGGHSEATISRCDAIRSGARGHKKRNITTVTIVDLVRGKERVIQEGLAIDAAIRTAHWEMLREVFGEVQRLSRSEQETFFRERFHWRWKCVLQTFVISTIEEVGHRFAGNLTSHFSRTTVAPPPVPAPARVIAPAPGLDTPASIWPRVFSVMEQRRLVRLSPAGHGSSSHVIRGGVCTTCDTPRRP